MKKSRAGIRVKRGMEVRRLVGRCVAAARMDAGLTQEAAASMARIDYKRWQTIERGSANPTIETLSRIATAIGLGFFDLLGDKTLRLAERNVDYDAEKPKR